MSRQGPGPGLVLPWEAVAGLGGLDPPGPGATVGVLGQQGCGWASPPCHPCRNHQPCCEALLSYPLGSCLPVALGLCDSPHSGTLELSPPPLGTSVPLCFCVPASLGSVGLPFLLRLTLLSHHPAHPHPTLCGPLQPTVLPLSGSSPSTIAGSPSP